MFVASVHYAKTQLSKLLQRVEDGGEVIIARSGKLVAKLTAYSGDEEAGVPGHWKGKVSMASDFDAEDNYVAYLFYGQEF